MEEQKVPQQRSLFSIEIDTVVPSLEDQMIAKESQEERLDEYDKKIDRLLIVLLTDKERFVFSRRVPGGMCWQDIAKEMGNTIKSVQWLMEKAERKLEAFRKFLSLL